jgi:hemoglobin
MPVTTEPELSAYERVGGAPAVKAVVDRFYQRVLADGELARYFADLDESGMTQLKRHQVAMVSQVLGGPRAYAGRDLAEAHRRLDIPALHYRRASHLLVGTMWEFDVPRTSSSR